MKKYLQLVLSISALAGLLIAVSCKDDDVPPVPSKLSFAVKTMTVNEADGIIEVEIVLDKPALENFTVDYKVSGTAQDAETETNNTPAADFRILEDLSDYGEVDFDKGQSVGIIQIQLFSDFNYEGNEIIEIELIDVDSDLVQITRDDEIKITIKQEDGLLVFLNWESPLVDLDLIIRRGASTSTLNQVVAGSLFGKPEFNIIPKAHVNAAFGLSYTYYSGEVDPLDFFVTFIEVTDGVWAPEANWMEYEGQYTLENINEWDSPDETIVAQTFEKVGNTWINFSEIKILDQGSRVGRSSDLLPLSEKSDGMKGNRKLSHK